MSNMEMRLELQHLDGLMDGFLPVVISAMTRAEIRRVTNSISRADHHLSVDNFCGWIASLIWEAATGAAKILRTMECLDEIPRCRALADYVSARALNS